MAKPRAKTYQQRLGFADEDLFKPKHDDLMIWLDANIEKITEEIFSKSIVLPFIEREIANILKIGYEIIKEKEDDINYCEEKARISKTDFENLSPFEKNIDWEERISKDIRIKKALQKFLDKSVNTNDLIKAKVINKIWEFPVKQVAYSGYKNLIGFIDLMVLLEIPYPEFYGLKTNSNGNYFVENENNLSLKYFKRKVEVYIEVKTEIKSLGELIRQINTYKTYLPGYYYVLSPDNKYKNLLKEQNIGFIEVK